MNSKKSTASAAAFAAASYTFDLAYMKDALEQFPEEKYLRIDVSGGLSPIVISADNTKMTAFLLPACDSESERDAA